MLDAPQGTGDTNTLKAKKEIGKKASTQALQRYADENSCTFRDIDVALGLSDGMCQRWIAKRAMPQWMVIALEGLTRGQRRQDSKTYLVKPGNKQDAFLAVLKSWGIVPHEI